MNLGPHSHVRRDSPAYPRVPFLLPLSLATQTHWRLWGTRMGKVIPDSQAVGGEVYLKKKGGDRGGEERRMDKEEGRGGGVKEEGRGGRRRVGGRRSRNQ